MKDKELRKALRKNNLIDESDNFGITEMISGYQSLLKDKVELQRQILMAFIKELGYEVNKTESSTSSFEFRKIKRKKK